MLRPYFTVTVRSKESSKENISYCADVLQSVIGPDGFPALAFLCSGGIIIVRACDVLQVHAHGFGVDVGGGASWCGYCDTTLTAIASNDEVAP